jgi:hypothetical protein
MLKFAFLLDIQTGTIINCKPEKRQKKLEKLLDMLRERVNSNSLVPQQRIVPIKVNATTSIFGQVNEKMILIGAFAATNGTSNRYSFVFRLYLE